MYSLCMHFCKHRIMISRDNLCFLSTSVDHTLHKYRSCMHTHRSCIHTVQISSLNLDGLINTSFIDWYSPENVRCSSLDVLHTRSDHKNIRTEQCTQRCAITRPSFDCCSMRGIPQRPHVTHIVHILRQGLQRHDQDMSRSYCKHP